MTLALEIEYLTGVMRAARSPADPEPDWPPQPDRVYSALVAAWAARGLTSDGRRALEWLEAQPAPDLVASGGAARTPATVHVPPNDPATGRLGNREVMPDSRRRQPRHFPVFRPTFPVVRFFWREVEVDDDGTVAALNALAADTPYVGSSASLTRCRFRTDEVVPTETQRPRRWVYPGRLAELERAYGSGHRPGPGVEVRAVTKQAPEPTRSVFANNWLTLRHVDGEMPDLRAAALVSKALRVALMSGYGRSETAIPAALSGHTPDGSPTSEAHLAIVPLAFLGSDWADGHVLGFALIPPGDGALLVSEEFHNALRAVAPWVADHEQRELRLKVNGFDMTFTTAGGAQRALRPTPYVATARTWATCTPIVMDRHLKAKGNAERETEIANSLRRSCVNIGLPLPAAVSACKHSAVQGAPSAYPSGHAPRWTGWRVPESLASRQLTHAVLQFDEPVRGPIILGAGRFAGLGLCRALD